MNLKTILRALRRRSPRAPVLPPDADAATLPAAARVPFRCNLCGTPNVAALADLDRERPSCTGCGSNVRFRAMAHLVVTELVGTATVVGELAERKDIVGIGLSDDECYARALARKFSYSNTWYHREPRLDIAQVPAAMHGAFDFVIASDVFEHVAPPVARAFANARRLLKPGGVFVLSVPFSLAEDTVEHFPELHDYQLTEDPGGWRLHNRTADGRAQVFEQLVFHGGPGSTLEMRLFSRAGLERELAAAGFASSRIAAQSWLPFGIVWPQPWSLPIVARA